MVCSCTAEWWWWWCSSSGGSGRRLTAGGNDLVIISCYFSSQLDPEERAAAGSAAQSKLKLKIKHCNSVHVLGLHLTVVSGLQPVQPVEVVATMLVDPTTMQTVVDPGRVQT